MILDYKLPENYMEKVKPYLRLERITYCVPYDIDAEGRFIEGWFVVTPSRLFLCEKNDIVRVILLSTGRLYRSSGLMASGFLEGTFDGEPTLLVRFSKYHIPRYAYIAKVLNDYSEGRTPKVRSIDDEPRCPNCGRLFLRGTRMCPECSSKIKVFKRLFSAMKPHWKLFSVIFMMFWINSGLRLLLPRINRSMIDDVFRGDRKDPGYLLLLIGGIALGNVLLNLVQIIRGRASVKASGRLTKDLREMVYRKIQDLSLGYVDLKKTGDLMNRISGDTGRIRSFITDTAVTGLNEIILILGVGILLFAYNWKLALLVIGPVPVVIFITTRLMRFIREIFHAQWHKTDDLNSLLQDILSGIRVVKAFGQEEREVARFKSDAAEVRDITSRNERFFYIVFPILRFVMGFGHFLILYFGGRMILSRELSLGEYVQFTAYASFIYQGLDWVSSFPRRLSEATTSAERLFEVMDEQPEIQDSNDSLEVSVKGNVRLTGVTFGYRSHEPVLSDINIDVKPGEMIGLVGHSGAGKSTVINLLMRLYDVDEGAIFIDEVDIRKISHESLKTQMGVVLQENFLFSGTIEENIRYSKSDATPDEVIRAAKIANAHDFIINFPNGYNTKVGERGQRLSGGERQRIAIARAVINDPKILILDEATASVDTDTEQKIQEALGRLIKNRTTFAIAHRLSTLKNANRIMVLEKGHLAELGTHDELLRKRGIYHKLVMAQRQMTRTQAV